MIRRARWSLVLAAFGLLAAAPAVSAQQLEIFDAHLHYNQEPNPLYSLDTVLETFRRNGVTGILGGYEKPHLIKAEKLLSFNEKAEGGHYDHEVPQSVFRRGMKVYIRDGIFAGSTGEIISGGHDGKGTAVVGIKFLGGITPANMPLAILEPL